MNRRTNSGSSAAASSGLQGWESGLPDLSGLDRGFIREDRWETLEAAIQWGRERCHNEAARALLPALAALLSEFNATVLPVEHEPGAGPEVDFRITLSRPGKDGQPRRLRYSIQSESDQAEPAPEGSRSRPTDGDHKTATQGTVYRAPAELCRRKPWDIAGIIVAQLLQDAVLNGK